MLFVIIMNVPVSVNRTTFIVVVKLEMVIKI
jgi:hypothetical protein